MVTLRTINRRQFIAAGTAVTSASAIDPLRADEPDTESAAESGGAGAAAAAPPRFVRPDQAAGTSAAVVVDPAAALAHTALIKPIDRHGEIVGAADAGAQADRVLSNLNEALAVAGSGLDQVVKLTVYAADQAALDAARASVAQAFSGPTRPAATWVVNRQPNEAIRVTMDAVAIAPLRQADRVTWLRSDQLSVESHAGHVAVMPPGQAVYIAGQVAPGETLAAAAGDTVRELYRTLEHIGLTAANVVQVKAFVQPIDRADDAHRAIAMAHGELAAADGASEGRTAESAKVPPIVITEWQAALPRPTEIELIAINPGVRSNGGAVRYAAPPWLSESPVFSRIALARADAHLGWVYFSGLTPAAGLTPTEQVSQVFGRLRELCRETGSNFQHLVKATYYVVDPEITKALGEVRPRYYDPQRPPAASLVQVRGAAQPDTNYTLDMIGVRVE